MPVTWHADLAWLGDAPAANVLITADRGRFTAVTPGVPRPPGAERLRGLTLPGLANAHSHAFHRALRGRTHAERGTFWTWRERMYAVADRLTPESYLALARAVFAEMALAGVTCVGEFHYLHHAPGGQRYDDPNEMGAALIEAASQAGIRITLLDTCYLTASVSGEPLRGPAQRFGDGSAAAWAARAGELRARPHARIGAAIHSVRAVPADQLPEVVAWARQRRAPLHAHLSEQRAENEAARAVHGRTPAELLHDAGALGPSTTVVHATHLTDADVAALGGSRTRVCLCPTTERDLGDGIGPAAALAAAGSPLSAGSDSHAVIDLLEEARAVELHERLRTERRGHFPAAALLRAVTAGGHASLGWDDAGTIAAGARADLVTVTLDSPRTAGTDPAGIVFAATAADVTDVTVDGERIVRDGRHARLDVAAALRGAIA
ncbi:formimidoylglutamate deiminase [Catenuloplanes atrovinosus]|uniref:Formiminoglutamate deiminase n=1 Tax=Catenuloplanes atrovinosus TaxID=137266 RepID=A0AAE3YUS9_9ACTN|nr:formimidoylglutamate deiminase [Catenuloplanes atrovinosus]MDR7278995.1 formiminoglutamate deiminase [Catenuloplanes atrovinosus]